jgi:hypothetical protein
MRPIEPDISTRDKIAVLTSELDAIHSADSCTGERGELSFSKARVEHRRRQDRLEQIRADLASQTVSKGKREADKKHPSTTLGGRGGETVSISLFIPKSRRW